MITIVMSLISGILLLPVETQRPRQGTLKVGDAAPQFSLKQLGSDKQVDLSKMTDKPKVLVFGSCTWPPFRKSVGQIEKLSQDYQGRIYLFIVYIREAHPVDGWQVPQNKRDGIEIKDPTTDKEREEVARDFAKQFKVKLPILIDTIDDKMEKAYAGWPDRLYVIDRKGKIAYVGKPGPSGFQPRDIPPVLDQLLKK